MGHLGLTPQSVHALGGFRVQGKKLDAARAIVDDAVALAEAGCFAIVLECVPDAVARHGHRLGPGPDDRHRRRPPLRRPGARVPRPARASRTRVASCRSSCAATRTSQTTRPRRSRAFADDVRAGGSRRATRRTTWPTRSPRRSASTAATTPEPRADAVTPVTFGACRHASRDRARVAIGVVLARGARSWYVLRDDASTRDRPSPTRAGSPLAAVAERRARRRRRSTG